MLDFPLHSLSFSLSLSLCLIFGWSKLLDINFLHNIVWRSFVASHFIVLKNYLQSCLSKKSISKDLTKRTRDDVHLVYGTRKKDFNMTIFMNHPTDYVILVIIWLVIHCHCLQHHLIGVSILVFTYQKKKKTSLNRGNMMWLV